MGRLLPRKMKRERMKQLSQKLSHSNKIKKRRD